MRRNTFLIILIFVIISSYSICNRQFPTSYQKLSLNKLKIDPEMKGKFNEFKEKFGKNYDDNDRELKNYMIFEDNMKKLSILNNQVKKVNPKSDLEIGANSLMDIPYDDFLKYYINLIPEDFSKFPTKSIYQNGINLQQNTIIQSFSSQNGMNMNKNSNTGIPNPSAFYPPSRSSGSSTPIDNTKINLPENFDYNQKNLVSAVKDQGSCGSCWAFATVGVIESMYLIKKGKMITLSEQQLISCNFNYFIGNFGCRGGSLSTAFNYVKTNKGLTLSTNYPYQAQNAMCSYFNIKTPYPIADYMAWDNQNNEDTMTRILVEYGVAAVAVEASKFFGYVSGIIDSSIGCTNSVNHAVILVGYGIDIKDGQIKNYWVVKNSWGVGWGEKGFFRIERGKNTCGIASQMVTVTLP